MEKTLLSGKRRNAMEIVISILENAKSGINKTRLVYSTNLNFLLIQSYIDLLVERNLIQIVEGRHAVFQTTEKGKYLLDEFSKVKEILGVDEIPADKVVS